MRPFIVCLTFSCYLLLSPVMMTSQTVGHIDQGFAKNGMVPLDKDVSQDDPHYVTTQPDGKILQVGKAYRKDSDLIVVKRLYEDGTLDKSFGIQGRVEIHIDGEVHDIASPNMEHIYLVGLVKSRQDKDFLIIRLLYDGSIDKNFADFGKKVLNLGGTDEAYALTFQKDGKILIGGNTYAQSWTQRDFALVRLLPSGKMDAEFGNGGIKRIDVGKYDSFQSMVIQEDEKILVCGYTKPDRFTRFAIFRLEPNGNPDPKFDGDGIKILETGVENNFCEGIALDKDQNILLMGHARRSK